MFLSEPTLPVVRICIVSCRHRAVKWPYKVRSMVFKGKSRLDPGSAAVEFGVLAVVRIGISNSAAENKQGTALRDE